MQALQETLLCHTLFRRTM